MLKMFMRMEIASLSSKRKKLASLSSLDLITGLPSHITEHILTFLPLPDAARTSILSRKWRYRWTKLRHIVVDGTFIPKLRKRHGDIVSKVLEILLVHQGPITTFKLSIPDLESCSQFNSMILFLSRNGIQELTISDLSGRYVLSSHIFSCVQLRHLDLYGCVVPPTFKGLSKLIHLEFNEAILPPEFCISGCPLLVNLTLHSCNDKCTLSIDAPNLKELWLIGFLACFSFINTPRVLRFSYILAPPNDHSFDLTGFYNCVPFIIDMLLDERSMKYLAEVERVPRKLPVVLNYLTDLHLVEGIDLTVLDSLSCILFFLRSSPNLKRLSIEVLEDPCNTEVEPVLGYFRMLDYSDVSLNKLRKVVIESPGSRCKEEKSIISWRAELEFIKFLLAISPKLKKIKIVHDWSEIEETRTNMLIESTLFYRASQNARIVLKSP